MRMKLLAAFGCALLVLVVAWFGVAALDRQEQAQARVHQSIELRSHARNLLEGLLAASGAQTGYLVNGDTEELSAVRRLREVSTRALAALAVTTTESAQLERIAAIRPQLDAVVGGFEEVLELIETRDRDTVREFVRTHREALDVAPIAKLIEQVRDAEDLIITDRKRISGERLTATRVLIISGSGIAFLLATFVIARIRRSVIELEAAHETISRQAVELDLRSRQLERTVRDLDQFAYVASHDLKAPLRGITTLAQWIQEDVGAQLDPEGREHLRLMQVRVARMEALVEGVLAYARAGRSEIPDERFDGNALIREVIDMLSQPGGSVVVDQPLPIVTGVKIALQQIWMNLISNALKHGASPDGHSVVHVGYTDKDGELVYYVADNGPGIEAQYHARIFGLFQTLEARDKVESTGIGLAVVKKLVEHHGGRVWLTSEVGKGTIFYFTFPSPPESKNLAAPETKLERKPTRRPAPRP